MAAESIFSFWHRHRILLAVLGTALLLRWLYLVQASRTPLFEVLLIDSEFYDQWARQIAGGAWLGDRVFFMNPFYPYFLAVVYVLSGVRWWVVGLVQGLVGTASCGLIFWLGREIWGRQVGLVAAGFAAVYGVFIFYDGSLLTATPILFFNLLGLAGLLEWRRTGRIRWLLGAGVSLGFSAAARPLVLLFAASLGLWFARSPRGWRAGLRAWAAVWLGIGFVLGVVGTRNSLVGGEWVLTTSSAGMNFYVGNHPGATGIYAQVDFLSSAEPEREREEFLKEAQRRAGRSLSPAAASRFWLGEGLRLIWEEPGRYLQLLGRKLYMFWNRVESQNNLSYYFARDFVPLLKACLLGWGVIVPLGLAGWFREGRYGLFDLYAGSYLAGCLLFFVSSEYRLPVVPVAMIYAARGLTQGLTCLRQGRYREVAGMAGLALLLGIPINYADAFASRLTIKRVDYYNFGALYERRMDLERAEGFFRRAVEIDPGFAPALQGLARIFLQQGRLEEVLEVRGQMAGLGKKLEEKQQRLLRGLEYFSQGEYEPALREFRHLEQAGVQAPELYNNLGLCYYKTGRMAEAKEALLRAIGLAPGYLRARYNLGLVFLAQERFLEAEKAFSQVVEGDPGNVKARYKLGELYARFGRRGEALGQWRYVLQAFPEDQGLRGRVDSLQELDEVR